MLPLLSPATPFGLNCCSLNKLLLFNGMWATAASHHSVTVYISNFTGLLRTAMVDYIDSLQLLLLALHAYICNQAWIVLGLLLIWFHIHNENLLFIQWMSYSKWWFCWSLITITHAPCCEQCSVLDQQSVGATLEPVFLAVKMHWTEKVLAPNQHLNRLGQKECGMKSLDTPHF